MKKKRVRAFTEQTKKSKLVTPNGKNSLIPIFTGYKKYTLKNDTTKIPPIDQISIYGSRDSIFSCAHAIFGLGRKCDLKVLLSLSPSSHRRPRRATIATDNHTPPSKRRDAPPFAVEGMKEPFRKPPPPFSFPLKVPWE